MENHIFNSFCISNFNIKSDLIAVIKNNNSTILGSIYLIKTSII